jgi:VWFA-related protein
MRRNIFLSAALLSCAASVVSIAQTPTFRVSSNMVLVDVVVRDSKGAFVPGLKASDFQLMDQGKPQKIASFELFHNGRPVDSAQIGGVPANWMVILIDSVNSTFEALGSTRDAVNKWLKAAPPGSPVMVAVLNRTQVRVLTPFTTDHAVALAMLAKAPVAIQLRSGIESVSADTDRAAQYAREIEQEVKESNIAMKRFVATLGAYPGRKNVVLLTIGYPLHPTARLKSDARIAAGQSQDAATQQTLTAKLGMIPDIDVTDSVQEIAATANTYGVSLYPVDSRGLVANPIEAVAQEQNRDSLHTLASLTGGIPTYNTNGLETGMQRAADELGEYYLIGFHPEAGKAGLHPLDVKLNQSGFQVRGRKAYLSGMTDEQRVDASILAALGQPDAVTAIPFASRSQMSGDKVAVDVAIPIDSIRFAPQGSGVHAQLQLLGLVTKPDGTSLGKGYQINRPYSFDLTAEQFKQAQAQQSLVTRNELALPKGEYQLTLVLRDITTGAIGALREKLEVK